jgi:hypothetical protein
MHVQELGFRGMVPMP